MDKFALSSMKIKSSWFDGEKKSVFQKIGKEEGLNLYLQLFRFRIHQGDIYKHHFILSIGELKKYTKINMTKKLSYKQILEILKKMDRAGIIKNHAVKDWNKYIDENGNVIADKILKLEATDVPMTFKNDKNEDQPIDKTHSYTSISFEMVNYIYERDLSSKALSIFYLIRKLSNSSKSERKAWININTMELWLGYGGETITSCLIELNKNGLVATYVKRNKGRITFEHFPVIGGIDRISEHENGHSDTIRKFLNRYNKNKNPFADLEDSTIDEEWGISPVSN